VIAGLRGNVRAKTVDSVLVDVGGVVYRVGTSAASLADTPDVGDEVEFLTHLVVREDQLSLYGFTSAGELGLFETLIAVTGVGPRLACAVLSRFRPEALLVAIADGDADMLATVPGVGKKTASRLILELRGKLPEGSVVATAAAPGDAEVVAALRSLGYSTAEANTAVVRSDRVPGMTVEERVVAALRGIGEG